MYNTLQLTPTQLDCRVFIYPAAPAGISRLVSSWVSTRNDCPENQRAKRKTKSKHGTYKSDANVTRRSNTPLLPDGHRIYGLNRNLELESDQETYVHRTNTPTFPSKTTHETSAPHRAMADAEFPQGISLGRCNIDRRTSNGDLHHNTREFQSSDLETSDAYWGMLHPG